MFCYFLNSFIVFGLASHVIYVVFSRYLSAKIATFVQFTKKIVQYLSKNLLFRTETPIFAPAKAKKSIYNEKKILTFILYAIFFSDCFGSFCSPKT